MQKFEVIIIGAGPGGVEAAMQARRAGLSTLLITGSKLGGRAVWGSLVPSKVWLTVAEKMDDLRTMHEQGLLVEDISLDMEVIKERINLQSTNSSQRYFHQLQAAGVVIEHGQARLVDPHQVRVIFEDETHLDFWAKAIVLATGSEPVFRPAIKPDGRHVLAPRHTAALEEIPSSLVIAGGGITGLEYGYAFAALGAEITLVQRNQHLLPTFDHHVVQLYQQHLAEHYNLRFMTGISVESMLRKDDDDEYVETILSDGQVLKSQAGLIAMSRKADLLFNELANLPLVTDEQGFIEVNEYQQTSLGHIYAIGDVTGHPMMANKATWEARKAIRHLHGDRQVYRYSLMEAVFTQPSLVQIGQVNMAGSRIVELPLHTLLKSHLVGLEEGLLRLHLGQDGRIRGAAGFGLHLPEIMALVQVAMQQNIPYDQLSLVPFGYPSAAELLSSAMA